jgi:hypothetical protein
LTDFTHVSTPQLDTCSVADLESVSPSDIWHQLRLLLIVVCALFGLMVGGGALGAVLDARERVRMVAALRAPEMGFREEGAVWTWRFTVAPLRGAVDAPRGPAVALCELMGVPLARLRLALPVDALSWSVNTALGRARGLSAAGFVATAAEEAAMHPPLLFARLRAPRASPKIEAALEDGAFDVASAKGDAEAAAGAEAELRDTFWGTALVLAFLQVGQLLPAVELAQRQAAARRHFAGVRTAAGATFARTLLDCTSLLLPGVLNSEKKWLPRTRLWRLILSQAPEGYWDACSSSAYATQACELGAVSALDTPLAEKLTNALNACGSFFDDGALEDKEEMEVDASGNPIPKENDMLPVGADGAEALGADMLLAADADAPRDCPLTFAPGALAHALPLRLARMPGGAIALAAQADAADEAAEAAAPDTPASSAARSDGRPRAQRSRLMPPQGPGPFATPSARAPPSRQRSRRSVTPHRTSPTAPADAAAEQAPATRESQQWAPPWLRPLVELAPPLSPGALLQPGPSAAEVAAAEARRAARAERERERAAAKPQRSPTEQRMQRQQRECVFFEAAAAAASMPREPATDALRVWTTLCCIAVLERSRQCWLWGDGDLYPEEERTIVDGAREWLQRYASERPSLQKALADGKLAARASELTKQWERCADACTQALRHSEGVMAQMTRSQVHRAATSVTRAFATKHDTLKVFLSVPLDGLQRWQSACAGAARACLVRAPRSHARIPLRAAFTILVTVVLTQLLVNIWMCASARHTPALLQPR